MKHIIPILLGLAVVLSSVPTQFGGAASATSPDDLAIWREFVAALKADSLAVERIHPPKPLTAESQLALLKGFTKGAAWEEWEVAPEIVRFENLVSFFITLGQKRNSPWTYTFNFEVEDGRWYYRFLEGIFLRLDKVISLPADAAAFPDRPGESKNWMRQEIYWSEQVRLFNFLSREIGQEGAWRWVKTGPGNGVGYVLGATTWVPYFPPHRAFIFYLCWEQAKLQGENITLEKVDDHEAVVRLDDSTYFSLYQRASHLKTQISFEDYCKIFETIWQDRAAAAGWKLTVDGQGRKIYLRFSR